MHLVSNWLESEFGQVRLTLRFVPLGPREVRADEESPNSRKWRVHSLADSDLREHSPLFVARTVGNFDSESPPKLDVRTAETGYWVRGFEGTRTIGS